MPSWRSSAASDSVPAASLAKRSDRLPKATSSQSFDTSIPAFARGAVTASLPCEFTFMTSSTVRVTRFEKGVRCALTVCYPASSRLKGETGLARITDNRTPVRSPEGVVGNAQKQAYDSSGPLAERTYKGEQRAEQTFVHCIPRAP